MNTTTDIQGIRTIIYPVKDIAPAKALFSRLLGVEPYMDEAYYVGFRVGGQDIGLDPNGHKQGMTGPLGYFHVSDIKNSLLPTKNILGFILRQPEMRNSTRSCRSIKQGRARCSSHWISQSLWT